MRIEVYIFIILILCGTNLLEFNNIDGFGTNSFLMVKFISCQYW